MIVCHIRTSAGARFDWAEDEEGLRQALIEYFNEVHADSDTDEMPDDATLDDVIDSIEEIEDVSYEDVYNGYLIERKERDTILAALRLWQHAQEGTLPLYNRALDTFNEINSEIAEDSGAALDSKAIDDLCERLNA